MALAGSGNKNSVYLASNQADLASSLGDIIVNSIPVPKCNCDATCYDEAAAFPLKGQPCSVGVGRCTRQGVYACNSTADGVVCAAAAGCGAAPLVAGVPAQEVCGTTPGCLAPTPADCADENCDGQIDECLSCGCAYQPEVCNGLDDNCNGIVDDVPSVSCGSSVGECRPGTTACVDDGAGGKKTVCQGAIGPQPEVCDNKDNDCDGVIDGFSQACFPAAACRTRWPRRAPSADSSPGQCACGTPPPPAVRQRGRVVHQVEQRDQRVRLAAAVGEIQLAHRLVALARQPPHHVPRQVAQVVGRVGQRKELRRVFVNRALAFLEDDLIQIGGEHRQR